MFELNQCLAKRSSWCRSAFTRLHTGWLSARTPYPESSITVKIILLGNAGAGKSTLSMRLTTNESVARLSLLCECDELIFLNPGTDICIAHCRVRHWEPEKFSSKEEQDEHLENLIEWVAAYETRSDEYGLQRHRALYEAFQGKKRELKRPSEYESV